MYDEDHPQPLWRWYLRDARIIVGSALVKAGRALLGERQDPSE